MPADSPSNLAAPYADRFWAKVRKNDGCWEWTASTEGGGYGQFRIGDVNALAHRVAYQLAVGPIPDGLEIDHLCRNRRCVRPDHLEPVTGRVNTLRGETITAFNARKTHCHRGHPLSGDNLHFINGKRICILCRRINERNRTRRRLGTLPEN